MTQKSFRFSARLDGPGVHPGAWVKHKHRVSSPSYDPLAEAREIVEIAEKHAITFCVFDDAYVARAPGDVDNVRYDAVSLAAVLARVTRSIGLVPSVSALLTEPFHISRSVATVDFLSQGRGGWKPLMREVGDAELKYAGANRFAGVNDNRGKRIGEFLEVTRLLWHSWEEDSVILNVKAGRFLDAAKVRRINYRGEFFSVAGPSPTPRPPQGSPLTVIDVEDDVSLAVAAQYANIAILKESEPGVLPVRAQRLKALAGTLGNVGLEVFASVAVYVDENPERALRQKAELDGAAGQPAASFISLTGSPADVAGEIVNVLSFGSVDGIELALVEGKTTIEQWARLLLPALEARAVRALPGHPQPASPIEQRKVGRSS